MAELLTIALGVGASAITAVGGVVVARIQAKRATKDEIAAAVAEATRPLAVRVAAAETTLGRIDGEEREDIAKLAEDVAAIGADLGRLREAVESRWRNDDSRREMAREHAAQASEKLHEHLATLREKVAQMAGAFSALHERGRHG